MFQNYVYVIEASKFLDAHRETVKRLIQEGNLTATKYGNKWTIKRDRLHVCPASTIFAGWRQSVLPVHLLGLDALLGCVGAVAGDVKLQDDGVMDHPVNRRSGGHGVGKDAFPL